MAPNHSIAKKFAVPRIAPNMPNLTVPVFCGMFWQTRWKVTSSGDLGTEVFTLEPLPVKEREKMRLIPSHEVREAFLQIKTSADALSFLETYGPLDQSRLCSMARIVDLKERIQAGRELNPKDYFPSGRLKDLRHFFERQPWPCKLLPGQAPYLRFEALHVEEAMHQATYVDQIAGIRSSTCPECGKQFSQEKRLKPKTYCDAKCQGRAAKTRWNANHGGSNAKA